MLGAVGNFAQNEFNIGCEVIESEGDLKDLSTANCALTITFFHGRFMYSPLRIKSPSLTQ